MTGDSPYRALPSLDRLLADERIQAAANGFSQPTITDLLRQTLEAARKSIAGGAEAPSREELVQSALALMDSALRPSLRAVINASGVIIHTNLGRAPLSAESIAAMEAISRGYSNLEFDLEAGRRGSRYQHLEELLCRLTGAEAALAVNNNASALLLGLSAVVRDREVIISRGQAVEIGGGFRIPDVMRQSGARLVEVGTTNRTYLSDYEEAIGPETAALLRVHASNFRITGFTESVPLGDLAGLAHERGLLLLDDLGSGCLLDTTQFGLAAEPLAQESVASGADLAFFSGDKLLGGPQAGIIVGKAQLVSSLKRHPLTRAVRMDKASIAGLTVTLLHYLKGEALEKIPVWRMIATPLVEIRRRARRWAREIGAASSLQNGRSMVGGGSLPEESLPTVLVAITAAHVTAEELSRRLRLGSPPVVARIERDQLLLDPRTVDQREDAALVAAVRATIG